MTHQNEIEATRVGGFGGSDAALFYKVGLKGLSALSATDKNRIAVAKGLTAYKSIGKTGAMQKGHDFEDWYAAQPFVPLTDREVELSCQCATNFRTFAHADFADSFNEVWELKCVLDWEKAKDKYFSQLQWYHMLGVQRVWLVVCDSSKSFEYGIKTPVLIYRDENYIKILQNGIRLIDENWDSFGLNDSNDWTTDDLLPFEQQSVIALTNYFKELKRIEAQAEELKSKIFEFMTANDVKSIKSDSYIINLIPESQTATFDKKKLLADHPEINEADYLKIGSKKSYITVKLL